MVAEDDRVGDCADEYENRVKTKIGIALLGVRYLSVNLGFL